MYQQVRQVETELCRYRKGSLNVKIDLDRGLLLWRDSNHWNNDFTRSLNPDDLEKIRKELAEMDVTQWATVSAKETPQRHCRYSWLVKLDTGADQMEYAGSDAFPPHWNEFRTLIESIARTTFEL